MAIKNNNERIWLISDYSSVVQEQDDTGIKPEGTMEIKTLDVLKQYVGKKRKLIIAVKVTDKKWNPVALAEVGLFVAQPDSNSISLYRYTNSEGVVLFEIDDPNSGVVNAGVTSIRHPCYKSDKPKLQDKWITIHV
jgi:hypothetical protein